MVGGQRAEGSPEQRVRARGEHRQALVALAVSLGAPLDAEADGGALGAADPLALHEAHLLRPAVEAVERAQQRSEEHTSELQSLMRISYAVFCLKKKKHNLYVMQTVLID